MRCTVAIGLGALLVLFGGCTDSAEDEGLALTVGSRSALAEISTQGGALELKSRARLIIPEGALDSATELRIEIGDLGSLPTRPGDAYEVIGEPLLVTPHGLELKKSAKVEIRIDDEDSPERELRVLRLDNEKDRSWEELQTARLVPAGDDARSAAAHRLTRNDEDTVTAQRRLEFEVDGFSVFLPVRLVAGAGSCAGRGSSATCRPSGGPCDTPEKCDGRSDACPPDEVEKRGESCRDSVGLCDVAEVCDGESSDCPADGVRAEGSVCRPASHSCDPVESCDGESVDCPEDVSRPAGACDPIQDAGGNPIADATPDANAAGGDAGDGGDGGVGDPNCPDTSGYSWSPLIAVEASPASPGQLNSIGIDDMGRAFALLEGGTGAAVDIRFTTYDPVAGWAATSTPLASSLSGGVSWYPRAVVNGAGDVFASYRTNTGAMAALHYDTTGAALAGGLNLAAEANNFWGGVAIGKNGKTLISYVQYDVDRNKGFLSIDYQTAAIVFDDTNGGSVSGITLAEDGNGVISGLTTDDMGVRTSLAILFTEPAGVGTPEPFHPPTHEVTNGSGAVTLGGSEVFAAFGSITGSSATRVQLFATHRDLQGTWSAPLRFDTGDDSSHASLKDVQPGRAGEAFVLWDQPDGRFVGRAAGSAVVGDIGTVGNNNNADHALRADRCGNAIYAYSDSNESNVMLRRYVAGSGWLAAAPIDADYTGIGQDVAVAMSPQGRAAVIFASGANVFYASTFGP